MKDSVDSAPLADTPVRQRIYKVSELTREVRLLLESRFPSVWVEGEISNFKRHSSGHIYFTLKDESAQIAAVFFARENQFLKFELKDGLQVIAIGRVSVYDQRGQYQLYVQRVEPKGLGALQLAFEQLKQKLETEGLFDPARKKAIPLYPKRIAIVTSPTGAAIQDILKVFRKRAFGLDIFLYPVRVQGEGAAQEIARAIGELNDFGTLDMMVVGRGGGSLEDLWAFNEEVVARAIAASRIPIISAVGHEVDFTISDMVADLRAHTPTAAAEKVLSHWNELEERVRQYGQRMRNAAANIVSTRREKWSAVIGAYAFRQPVAYLEQMSQQVDELLRQMQNYAKTLIAQRRQAFCNVLGKLEALSPLSVLERGYSITLDKAGKIIRDVRRIEVGQTIGTRFKNGSVESQVTKVGVS